jgi:hypothetical protein
MFKQFWKAQKPQSARRIRNYQLGSGLEMLEERAMMSATTVDALHPLLPTHAAGPIAMAADGNDTQAGAINLGTLTGAAFSTVKTGSVGSSGDLQDYYKFTLSSGERVRINLSGLSADLDIRLENGSASTIFSSLHTGSSSESISGNLSSGTFFIKIYKGVSSANSSYSLSFSVGDDSFGTAQSSLTNDGTTASYTSFLQHVGGSDTQDFRSITLTKSNLVTAWISGLSADVDLQLQNSSGTVISSSVHVGSSSETVRAFLQAGTYYVRAYKGVSTASSNYTMSLSLGDDSRAAAVALGTVTRTSVITRFGDIGGNDTQDYYSFVAPSSSAKIELTGLSADLDFELLNSSGVRIGTAGTHSGTTSELQNYSLGGGTYYIRVFKGVSTAISSYTLKLTMS